MRLQAAITALSAGDPLAALAHVALHDDAPSLALRGLALAQIGDLPRAQGLLTRAARGFGPEAPLARARCVVALAEISLAARELGVPLAALARALSALAAAGDAANALHARLVLARCWLTLGQPPRAAEVLAGTRLRHAPPQLQASAELIRAELALRQLDVRTAERALQRGRRAAERAAIPALQRELARVAEALSAPAARVICAGEARTLSLRELGSALAQPGWQLDVFTRGLRARQRTLSLARRPVLFALLRALAEAHPQGVTRGELCARGFGVRKLNASHRARLRVELGRLRKLLAAVSGKLVAEADGYRLELPHATRLRVLAPPQDGEEAQLLALLGDGRPWSSSALARALGVSQRSLQRALLALQERGAVRSSGRGRAQRWLAPPIVGLGLAQLGLFQAARGLFALH